MTQDELDKLALTISQNLMLTQKEILTVEEAAIYTGLKKSQLYKLTSTKAIPHYKPSGKNCFFKRTELEEWLTRNPVATAEELNDRALAYCMKRKIHY